MSDTRPGELSGASTLATIVGSCLFAELPADLDLFFSDEVLIDRRNNTPMEMDGYSIYLTLTALERTSGVDLAEQRRRLVNATVRRLQAKGGFWAHGAWTGSDAEVHLRFTAAAIRLLIEALEDGLLTDSQLAIDALKRHVSFRESILGGVWFLHDSLEMPGVSNFYRNANRYRAWGASTENCLVLNTHVDTLVTLLHFLQRVKINGEDHRFFAELIDRGLVSLSVVLSPNLWGKWSSMDRFDSFMRAFSLLTYTSRSLFSRKLRGVINRTYFRARGMLKRRFPRFVLSDGYIEREIGLNGSFVYHITNVYDLARLSNQLRVAEAWRNSPLIDRCDKIVDDGINYAVRSAYKLFWQDDIADTGRAIVLCDAILARLAAKRDGSVPQDWISAYCKIRRAIPPSAAILGYDPLVVKETEASIPHQDGFDIGTLYDGRLFKFDLLNESLCLGDRKKTLEFT